MFTDIVGYSTLMGADEQTAFKVLKKALDFFQQAIDQDPNYALASAETCSVQNLALMYLGEF
jgi:hypothetical protein